MTSASLSKVDRRIEIALALFFASLCLYALAVLAGWRGGEQFEPWRFVHLITAGAAQALAGLARPHSVRVSRLLLALSFCMLGAFFLAAS